MISKPANLRLLPFHCKKAEKTPNLHPKLLLHLHQTVARSIVLLRTRRPTQNFNLKPRSLQQLKNPTRSTMWLGRQEAAMFQVITCHPLFIPTPARHISSPTSICPTPAIINTRRCRDKDQESPPPAPVTLP